jgi:protein arginine kinase activator
MKCQFCSKPATLHLMDVIQHQKREIHLCEACAQQHQLIPMQPKPELNVPALLEFLIQQTLAAVGKFESGDAHCPQCGMAYSQFRAQGRLGCPHDYQAFMKSLEPLLERIHRRLRHVGKIPKKAVQARMLAEIQELKQQLRQAVAEERYENAAQLRDLIRVKEAADETR